MTKRFVCLFLSLLLLVSTAVCAIADTTINGSYTASANGNNGEISLSVDFEAGKICTITILNHKETVGLADPALERIPQQIIEQQSIAVDAVSGATNTSNAIIKAVAECIAAAGGNPEDYAVKNSKEIVLAEKQYTTDIVVVGAGLSGLTAAVSAAEAGASVIMVEKAAFAGGASLRANSGYMVVEIDENEAYHITEEEDHLPDALNRWKTLQAQSVSESIYPDYDRLADMFIKAMPGLYWMQDHGIIFTPKRPIADKGMAVVTGDAPDMQASKPSGRVIEKLVNEALALGVQIIYEAPAVTLLTQGDAVVGVEAISPDSKIEILAKKTILACGSYPDNSEMIAELVPQIPQSSSTSATNVGDGIRMAMELGAVLYEDQWPTGSPSPALINENPMAAVFVEGGSPLDVSESTYSRLMVNANGERFMNEAGHYSLQVMIFAYDNNGPYWSVYNGLDPQVAEIAETGLAGGTVIKGNSIEELAVQAGMDPSVLRKTFDRYNSMAKNGVDEDFGKKESYFGAYSEEGPYYLVQVIPSITDIMGGIKTNYDYEVIREDGSTIENLYAIGSMSNRPFYNQWYVSGSFLTFAAVAGQLAGTHAAQVIQ